MKAIEAQNLRTGIEREIADLERSAANIKEEVLRSAEVCENSLGDAVDSAKDERNLKAQIEIHNHTVERIVELQRALRRMKHGGFGICRVCSSSIAAKRLQARPGAIFCLVCQEHSEDRITFQNSVGDSAPKVCRLQRKRCQVA